MRIQSKVFWKLSECFEKMRVFHKPYIKFELKYITEVKTIEVSSRGPR